MPARTYPSSKMEKRSRREDGKGDTSLTPTMKTQGSSDVQAPARSSRLNKVDAEDDKWPSASTSRRHHSKFHNRTHQRHATPPLPQHPKQQLLDANHYAHTSHSHVSTQSHYQLHSAPGLPSANTWPHQSSLADRSIMDDDLLGLGFSYLDRDPYSTTTKIQEEELIEYDALSLGAMDDAHGTWRQVRDKTGVMFACRQDGGREAYGYDFVHAMDRRRDRL